MDELECGALCWLKISTNRLESPLLDPQLRTHEPPTRAE